MLQVGPSMLANSQRAEVGEHVVARQDQQQELSGQGEHCTNSSLCRAGRSSSKSWANRQGAAEVTAPAEQAEEVWHDQQQELTWQTGCGMSSSKSWAGRQGAAEVTAPAEQAEGVWHDQQQELSRQTGYGMSSSKS